SEFLLEKRI
nr:Chain P, SV40 epitope, SEFLLEKRI [synthetic construct]1ZT7_Q Chain Q, SV40 epitope, SEFLLEKRI [synthetic construct]